MTGPATVGRPVEGCGEDGGGGPGGRAAGRRRGRGHSWGLGRWARDAPVQDSEGRDDRGRAERAHDPWWRSGPARLRVAGDAGMATAEYAIATIAAAGFAGLLVVVLRSDEVRGLLTGLVRTALSM